MAIIRDKVVEAFQSWDAEGHGVIGRTQLVRIIRRLTPGVNETELEALFSAAGLDADSCVKYNDFIDWLWAESGLTEDELRSEAARERGLWESALEAARIKAAETWPPDRVAKYFDEVEARLLAEDYIQHVKREMFIQADQDHDGKVGFHEAKALINKSLRCAADLVHAPRPTQDDVRDAFDAHDTLVEGRGRMGMDEFLNLARYLQVRVAEAMLPFSKVMKDS
ncbi:unnamed protein product [Polarella glacialis]|uniref:EF-hand domain-containing protein n=1 Tax=Polarella glacialis TaxID=89957 RepID=A0A813LM34_POLGL|nr:unnamed protein product [Polarella glacialis]|mmetsp:Transcript_73372/g.132108  ORF Transcript_73372/g.132108 Transcript_73372/m.132108 type:complete len:224 (+) Transcript_73372:82-753(+)